MVQPKDPSTRQRRNAPRASVARLPANPDVPIPALPAGDWHPMTLRWWEEIWSSPMAVEFLKADRRGLIRLATLEDAFWRCDNETMRVKLSAEIRLVQKDYGLTPYDRRRLEWSVESAEEAKDRGETRRQRKGVSQRSDDDDPRSGLSAAM